MNLLQKTKTVEPYSQLAGIYDFVMRHVDYKDWANYLHRLFAKAEININNVLDISCGTANLLLELSDLGYRVDGFDSSHAMVRIAEQKISELEKQVALWTSSMTQFAVKSKYDAIVCTYDSINYCFGLKHIAEILTKVEKALNPGGVFIFDVSTIKNSKQYFQKYYDTDGTSKFEYIRQSYFLIDKRHQVNEFYITFATNKRVCFKEIHKQKIYRISELKDVILSSTLSLVGVYNGFTLLQGTEKSDRVHFLLKKTSYGQNS